MGKHFFFVTTSLIIFEKKKIYKIKCITKKCTTLTENMQLKVTSTRYFMGLFNPSLRKSEISTKNSADFSCTAKAYV